MTYIYAHIEQVCVPVTFYACIHETCGFIRAGIPAILLLRGNKRGFPQSRQANTGTQAMASHSTCDVETASLNNPVIHT
jgi:hypothetical protein